jgi:hypothetical protein
MLSTLINHVFLHNVSTIVTVTKGTDTGLASPNDFPLYLQQHQQLPCHLHIYHFYPCCHFYYSPNKTLI